MAYRADIEIAVRGAQELKRLQNEIKSSSDAVNSLNSSLNAVANLLPRSFNNLNRLVSEAATEFNKVALGTQEATDAARLYARATDELNAGLRERVQLLKQVREEDRKARLAVSGIRETTQYAGPIGPGQASPVALRSELRGRTQQILDERRGRVELNAVLQDQFEIERQLQNSKLDEKAAQVQAKLDKQAAAALDERKGRVELNAVLQDQFEAERQLQNSKLDEKAAQVQAELDKQAAAAAESATQVEKLTARQAEFTSRTDAAAQAAAKQTAAFYRQARIAKEVAKINATAGPAQLLLAPAAPGAPAMGGGARRRITGQVERLGGARTADEAAATLRLAQATDALVQSTSKIDPQYNRFLPDTAALNATGRGIQRLTTNQEEFNQAVQRGIRFEAKYNQELERRRRLGIGVPTSNRMPGRTGATGGPFPVEGPISLSQFGQGNRTAAGAALRGRASGAIGNALIGGAFPLLFGQGAGAATGGAIGGLVGGAFGGVGGFAGSLVGTLLGDIASRGQAVKQLAEDIGFSAEQTKQLSAAFKVANTDVEKFTGVIQNVRGLGLELEDQAQLIQLVTQLTTKYGGSFEKTGTAITGALEAGKVTQATLNQLTSQGINIQEQLAAKFGVSRDTLLDMTKKGKIGIQDLVNALVDMGNKGVEATKKPATGMERLGQAAKNVGSALSNLGGAIASALGPALDWLAGKLSSIINLAATGIQYIARMIGGGTKLENQASAMAAAQLIKENPALRTQRGGGPKGTNLIVQNGVLSPGAVGRLSPEQQKRYAALEQKALNTLQQPTIKNINVSGLGQTAPTGAAAKGPTPPEDRTAQLLEDLQAMKAMSETQDKIRDALYEGNQELVIKLEYDKKVADINRDTAKALLNANYESEKAVINAQQIVRLKDAQLERDDELRNLAREINEIITNTLDDLRGGISWDDTGLRDIFDMRLPDAVNEINENINQLIDPANRIIGAATAIGDAFAASFSGIASGAMTAREGLSNFFRSVGQYFIDMAATIAAEALKLQAISLLQGIFSKFLNPFGIGSMSLPGLEGTGALSTGPLFPGGAFAEGGFVTGPTRALIGEGGQSEYVIPANKMRGAMSRYSAGARGSAVIPSGSDTEGGGTATMAPASIDVRYTVERINSVDYVTADQFQAGLQQAASQGAERGQQLALRRLQQSPSTRRRVGI